MTPQFTMTPLAAAFLVALALPAHAQTVYKWQDAQGKVYYSNVPSRAEARFARPVEDRISVINPIDIQQLARPSSELNSAAGFSQRQALAVQPMASQETISGDGFVPSSVIGYPMGVVYDSAYRQRLIDYYNRSLQPAPDALAPVNAPSQAAIRQATQAAATAQAQAANNPQQAATAREAARINANRTAAIQAGTSSSRTTGAR